MNITTLVIPKQGRQLNSWVDPTLPCASYKSTVLSEAPHASTFRDPNLSHSCSCNHCAVPKHRVKEITDMGFLRRLLSFLTCCQVGLQLEQAVDQPIAHPSQAVLSRGMFHNVGTVIIVGGTFIMQSSKHCLLLVIFRWINIRVCWPRNSESTSRSGHQYVWDLKEWTVVIFYAALVSCSSAVNTKHKTDGPTGVRTELKNLQKSIARSLFHDVETL